MRFKNYVLKKLFSDDDSYADGEYEQKDVVVDENGLPKKKNKSKSSNGGRENWAGRCDFFLSCLGYAVRI